MEINSQELDGKSAAVWRTAVRLTVQGRCGWWFTHSYECTSPNVRCGKTTSILWQEDKMEGIIGTLEFYAPVLVLGVVVIGIVYFMKKRNDRK